MNTTAYFKMLLEASWQGSLVILLILILRPLLGWRIPARWRSLLWSLALLRLLVPAFLLPPSPASLQNLAAVDRPLEEAGRAIERLDPAPGSARPIERLRNQGPSEGETLAPTPATPAPRPWWQVATAVWMTGCALTALWILAGTIRLHRRLRHDSREVDAAIRGVWEACCLRLQFWSAAGSVSAGPLSEVLREELPRAPHPNRTPKAGSRLRLPPHSKAPRLAQTDAVSSPALLGIWRPVLLIPHTGGGTLSAEDWEHIFLHELAHFRRRDHWLHALQLLALCAHWFNPLVWLGFRYLRADRELAADEWALRHLAPGRGAVAYGDTLLKILTAQTHRGLTPGLVGILEDGAQMRQRLRHIVAFTPRRPAGSLAGMVLVVGLAAIILTAAQGEVGSLNGWSVGRLSIPKNGEIKDAYVELTSPSGRAVTLTAGVAATEGVTLEKVEWVGSPVRARVILRKEQESTELFADAALVSRKDDLERRLPLVEIESKFIEIPDALARELLTFPGRTSFMDKFPGTPLPADAARSLAFGAVLNEKDAEDLLRKLDSLTGVDILSAPRVTTRSRQRAVIEITREFLYPTKFEREGEKPVTATEYKREEGKPVTPTAYKAQNLGVTLSAETKLGEGDMIDLRLTPDVVELLGFISYPSGETIPVQREPDQKFSERVGAPRFSEKPYAPGEVRQPVFSTRKTTLELTVLSGQTVVFLGGSAKEMKGFELPSAGRQLIVLVRASRMKPGEATDAAGPKSPSPASGAPPASDIPVGVAVPGKPGFVTSPHSPKSGSIDVRGFAPGTEVKDPYSGKLFRVPPPSPAGKSGAFSPAPFRLDGSPEPAAANMVTGTDGVRVPLPVGPVRIDYGQPIPAEPGPSDGRRLDGPGPGYRAQESKAPNQ